MVKAASTNTEFMNNLLAYSTGIIDLFLTPSHWVNMIIDCRAKRIFFSSDFDWKQDGRDIGTYGYFTAFTYIHILRLFIPSR